MCAAAAQAAKRLVSEEVKDEGAFEESLRREATLGFEKV